MNNVKARASHLRELRNKLIEPISIHSYTLVVFNAIHVAVDWLPSDCDRWSKINLAIQIMDQIRELRVFNDLHGSMVNNCFAIIERQDTPKRINLIKKESIAQKALECVIL